MPLVELGHQDGSLTGFEEEDFCSDFCDAFLKSMNSRLFLGIFSREILPYGFLDALCQMMTTTQCFKSYCPRIFLEIVGIAHSCPVLERVQLANYPLYKAYTSIRCVKTRFLIFFWFCTKFFFLTLSICIWSPFI